MSHPDPDPLARASAEAAWRTVTLSIAATQHVRVSRDGGRTYPAKHARALPEKPPGHAPCTVPVFDPGLASGRMLALDLDAARGDVDHQAAELGQLLGRLGARYLADASPNGRHLYVLFSAPLPWRELRDAVRAMAVRFSSIDPAPMSSLGAQISPPGSRHKSGGWRLLSTPLSEARAAVEHPNGPEAWNALLTEFAAELHHVFRQHGDHVLHQAGDTSLLTELDDVGVPWIPRLGGRASLGTDWPGGL